MKTRLFSVLVALAAAAPALAQAPTTKVLDCTNAGCHAKELEHKFVHGPAAVKACDACHTYVDPAKHSFALKREGKDLCLFCHIDKTGTEGPVVHEPVAKGDCTGCHGPHGGVDRTLLKKGPMAQLCSECHKGVLDGKHVHGPAATDCTACHRAHTAHHPKLLTMESRALCLNCHEDLGKTVAGFAHQHKPVEGDCLQCHTPHASNVEKVLKATPAELCASCHGEVGKQAMDAKHPHSAVVQGRACLNCHTPHGSDHAKQLTKDTVSSCLECHAKPIKVDEKRTVNAVAELAVNTMHRHGPISLGECGGCHDVHGGQHANLLQRNYARGFYEPFSDEAYDLCFKCHDRRLATAEEAGRETGFRDGTRNLHYLHVNKPQQGRSCRACHSIHASKFEQQIAESVAFGQWKLPINFIPTANGGSCSPGCHNPVTYNRGSVTGPIQLPGDKKPPAQPANPQTPQQPQPGVAPPPANRPPPLNTPPGNRPPPSAPK